MSLYLVFVLKVVMMGRWSDESSFIVDHVSWLNMVFWAVVISGDVGCWRAVVGFLVGVFVLSMR